MNANTPGPWTEAAISPYVVVASSPAHGHVICSLSGACSDEEVRANARLICAAPWLLAAAEALCRWYRQKQDDAPPAALDGVFMEARAAIARAKGEQP